MSLRSIYAELILQLLSSRGEEVDALVLKEEGDTALRSADKFLSSHLVYTTDAHGQDICLLQSGDIEIGVMMGWERGISTFHFVAPWGCMLKGDSN
jgi:protein arginine N-methyltransferase 2